MTFLCPEHVDVVWFVQFFVRNARSREEFDKVTRRVRARRSGGPSFVEDEFTVRFNEMREVLNRRLSPPQADAPLQSRRSGDSNIGEGCHDQDDLLALPGDHGRPGFRQPPFFGYPQAASPIAVSPGNLVAGQLRQFESPRPPLSPELQQQAPGGRSVPHHSVGPHLLPSISQNAPFGGVERSHLVPAGRQHFGGLSGQPQSSEFGVLPNNQPSIGPPPIENSFGEQPYEIHRPEPPIPPLEHHRPFESEGSPTGDDDWWRNINPIGGFSSQANLSLQESSAGLKNNRLRVAQRPVNEPQSGPSRDTSVAGASPWAPPAGNTTGLRPVQRWTWNLNDQKWRSYYVWSL
jgi:hypothetical protein